MLVENGFKIVCIDFWRRHFLVYDPLFRKIGTADLRKGIWTFTFSATGENFFGYSRDDAINDFLKRNTHLLQLPVPGSIFCVTLNP